ncbi:EamA/RhaT family transporter [Streptomyces sp. WI04-05B]|uniref:EamA/RhaT family transporter n=1 Tax=Streptomyces TaxID=1883 RepID=UPI0029AC4F9B|nr:MULTISPECIES: EamA/RhaT family transporter [unclassified Streptomyces]MDX2544802.1 EamA/RhaT family transporter [Streptomyces sp. WI04-05B]MDX2588672.1 EamA/RhaT family transporter [Streptomyces sp. WI04-05A]
MSDKTGTTGDARKDPRPEPLRFFGTTWVNHDAGYQARRVGVAAGSLTATIASCLILRFAYEGLRIAEVGGVVTLLVVVMFAVCSVLAFGHTWGAFTTHPDPARQASLRGLLTIGFVGTLTAYFLRSLKEAPGESLHRQEYEASHAQQTRRSTRRTGNPAKRRTREDT